MAGPTVPTPPIPAVAPGHLKVIEPGPFRFVRRSSGRCPCGFASAEGMVQLAKHKEAVHGCDIDAEGWCDAHALPWEACGA
jgi:hypothetical protein